MSISTHNELFHSHVENIIRDIFELTDVVKRFGIVDFVHFFTLNTANQLPL